MLFTRNAVRAVDQEAIERYGIPGIVLMENAARGLCDHAIDMLRDCHGSAALILCGGGNNGGDGYALARHLVNAGYSVELVALGTPRLKSDAAVNAAICQCMRIPKRSFDSIQNAAVADLIIDAVFGTGLDRPVRDDSAAVIDWINVQGRPVLAVDTPSGLDCDTGCPLGTTVRATRTVTFVGLKPGLLERGAQQYVGDLHVVGIGAPLELIKRHGQPLTPDPED